MRSLLSKIVYFPLRKYVILRNHLYTRRCPKIDYRDIPIYINNRNRLTFLQQLLARLEEMGYRKLIVIDNDSDYPPLLEYYKSLPYRVIFAGQNLGFLALEKLAEYKQLRKQFFVYTDSDVVPVEECPDNFLEVFRELLMQHPSVQKVGFSLKTDDLPGHFEDKSKVVAWEAQFSTRHSALGYEAPIDTTFALHRPYAQIGNRYNFRMIRMPQPFEARHLPWYNDSRQLSEEEKYYISRVEIGTHWSKGLALKEPSFFARYVRILK